MLEATDDTDINAFTRAARECMPERSGDLKADFKRLLDFKAVKTKNDNLDALLSAFDGLYERANAVSGLNEQFQAI